MKIDSDDIGVFAVTVPLSELNDWLIDPGADLVEVNGALDDAASWANVHKRSFVLIEVK